MVINHSNPSTVQNSTALFTELNLHPRIHKAADPINPVVHYKSPERIQSKARTGSFHQFGDPPDVRTRSGGVQRVLLAQFCIDLCAEVTTRFYPLHYRLLLACLVPEIRCTEPGPSSAQGRSSGQAREPGP